jgi:DnaA regulatory inactivator Hda
MTASAVPEQLTLPIEHRVAQGVEDFLVTDGNRRAVEWIDRWPDWPFTALVVVGPAASGKTHLANVWKVRAVAETVSLGDNDIEAAVAAVENHPIFIDNCDAAVRDSDGQRALLRIHNLARAAGRQLLLTAQNPPSAWGITLADLSSRLNTAMVVDIEPPDDQTLWAITRKLFSDRQIAVDETVVAYVLSRSARSFTGLSHTVDALDKAAWAAKRPITIALAREVLSTLGELD